MDQFQNDCCLKKKKLNHNNLNKIQIQVSYSTIMDFTN